MPMHKFKRFYIYTNPQVEMADDLIIGKDDKLPGFRITWGYDNEHIEPESEYIKDNNPDNPDNNEINREFVRLSSYFL